MRKTLHAVMLCGVITSAFLLGSWYSQRATASSPAAGARRVLYFVDPMHPGYKSDKPGIAPDCGMELVPVYDDGSMNGDGSSASAPPGTVNVGPAKQQIIGVRIAPVERASGSHTLRILGRVAADETRTYRINGGIDGYIREVSAVTTGDHVKKGQVLATFSAPLAISVVQTYILASGALDRARQSAAVGSVEAQAAPLANTNVQQRTEQLQNMGVSALQLEEIRETRQVPERLKLVAPGDGIVLARNVSVDQKFDRGTELYRIADLRQVWIVADVYENEAQYLQPGKIVTATLPQQQTFHARVSKVRPQFDPVTRTRKVRLEADNPGDILRPDMFVDLELPVTFPSAVVVSADAVVDSGVKQIVYVEKGDGAFESRRVKTGWRHGDQVEIVDGLTPGERIVVSGTFLLDSESRMKAAAGMTGNMHAGHAHSDGTTPAPTSGMDPRALARSVDPVCGMEVDHAKAKTSGRSVEYNGRTYYFCSDDCKMQFGKEPAKYSRKANPGPLTPAGKRLTEVQWEGGTAKEKESARLGHAHPPAQPAGSSGHQHP